MRFLFLVLSTVASYVFSIEAFACGDKKYDLQTEVEINGEITRPKIVAVDRDTVISKTTKDGVDTTVQVFAEELWDETHQGDAVKLRFKVYQSKGRQSLGDANFTIITKYGQASEMSVAESAPAAKPTRVKVTAKKI